MDKYTLDGDVDRRGGGGGKVSAVSALQRRLNDTVSGLFVTISDLLIAFELLDH